MIKKNWEECYEFCKTYSIDYWVTFQRKSLVNTAHIEKTQNLYIFLPNDIVIKLSPQKWKELKDKIDF
ncbi:hypothetical protein AB4865_05700 [Capnocytophaga sp. ARDL2]|uniref:hypothetical protein n=1 Tax=Capnocytophaga sp. ARDL2 TaxID=3238809 RepID=UPI003558C71E